jgi:hypothetical protein
MQEVPTGACPVHADALVSTCDWCAMGDPATVLEHIRAQLRAHLFAENPRAILLSVLLLGTIDGAAAADATVGLPLGATRSRRFLVRSDAVLPLD